MTTVTSLYYNSHFIDLCDRGDYITIATSLYKPMPIL